MGILFALMYIKSTKHHNVNNIQQTIVKYLLFNSKIAAAIIIDIEIFGR